MAVLWQRAERNGVQPIPHRPAPAKPHEVPLKSGDGSQLFLAPHPVLAGFRHVGEAIAVDVAENNVAGRIRPSGCRCSTPKRRCRPRETGSSRRPLPAIVIIVIKEGREA